WPPAPKNWRTKPKPMDCGCWQWLRKSQAVPPRIKASQVTHLGAQAWQALASPEGDAILCFCSPRCLARLLCASSALRPALGCEWVRRRATEWSLNQQCCRLEHLAFLLAMSEHIRSPESHHVHFGYGGGTVPLASGRTFLRAVAGVAQRFPHARVHIDAHTGVHAPNRRVADRCSQARAQSVRKHLVEEGVPA
ncbi:unnamed protein product, partial [Effrenium voratum]